MTAVPHRKLTLEESRNAELARRKRSAGLGDVPRPAVLPAAGKTAGLANHQPRATDSSETTPRCGIHNHGSLAAQAQIAVSPDSPWQKRGVLKMGTDSLFRLTSTCTPSMPRGSEKGVSPPFSPGRSIPSRVSDAGKLFSKRNLKSRLDEPRIRPNRSVDMKNPFSARRKVWDDQDVSLGRDHFRLPRNASRIVRG